MTEETIILVVHDKRLRLQIFDMRLEGRYVVGPLGPTLGRHAKAVVFVDQPNGAQLESAGWSDAYRDWVACALLTRLTPDGVVVGLPEAARSDATTACVNTFI